MTEQAAEQVQESATEQADQQQQLSIEDRARQQGWVSQDEFKGPPEKWSDAKTFVERGDRELPILRERLRKLEADNARTHKALEDMAVRDAKGRKEAYQQAIKDLKAQKAEAIAAGDGQTVTVLEEQIDTYKEELQQIQEPAPQNALPDYARQWMDDNKWYGENKEMRYYAEGFTADLSRERPDLLTAQGLPKKEMLDEISKEVRRKFAQTFEPKNTNRDKPPAVEGGSTAPQKKRGRSFDDLPKDAQDACKTFMANSKNPEQTKKNYVSNYFSDEA